MARDRKTRQREYELMELERSIYLSGEKNHTCRWDEPIDHNTMGPSEDVLEKRRQRKRLSVNVHSGRHYSSRNILAENAVMLFFVVVSIYGLYRLIIYLLNQS